MYMFSSIVADVFPERPFFSMTRNTLQHHVFYNVRNYTTLHLQVYWFNDSQNMSILPRPELIIHLYTYVLALGVYEVESA